MARCLRRFPYKNATNTEQAVTNIQRRQDPAPLDISHLDVGPPLDALDDPLASTALVPYRHHYPARHGEQALPGEDVRPAVDANVKKLSPPDAAARRASRGRRKWHDVRRMSPREMLSYSQSLYAAGILGFDDYEALAFQPDLHPAYANTIGALTGEIASPDRPRNFVRVWQERLNYARRYHAADSTEVRQADRILTALVSYPSEADALS